MTATTTTPGTVTKSAAKSVNLPVGSATALLAWANDAGNWSGQPMVNDTFGCSTGGYVAKLVTAGLITAQEDGEETFVSFTPAGVEVALKLGADPASISPEAPAVVTPAVKVCKKDASHGEHRVTKNGSYCYACDRIVAERQKAERAAAKVASK